MLRRAREVAMGKAHARYCTCTCTFLLCSLDRQYKDTVRPSQAGSISYMRDVTILAMSDDASWLGNLWTELKPRGGLRVVTAASIEDACALIDCARARLIVVDWRSENISYEEMDALLWANSTLRHPAAVVVISGDYQSDQALSLYQMGVDEYLGMSHHADQVGSILSEFLSEPRTQTVPTGRKAVEASGSVPAAMPLAACWVATAAPA